MPTQRFLQKKCMKMFCGFKKESYLCNRYPENNLFTLKKLIPIEDRAISCEACRFFYALSFPSCCFLRKKLAGYDKFHYLCSK